MAQLGQLAWVPAVREGVASAGRKETYFMASRGTFCCSKFHGRFGMACGSSPGCLLWMPWGSPDIQREHLRRRNPFYIICVGAPAAANGVWQRPWGSPGDALSVLSRSPGNFLHAATMNSLLSHLRGCFSWRTLLALRQMFVSQACHGEIDFTTFS